MIKNPCKFIYLLAVVFATGCVSGGSHIVTGKPRPVFSADAVRVYSVAPAGSDEIGVVTALASVWTAQGDADRCLVLLKREASKIGANGICDFVLKTSLTEGTTASAKAIFVP
jgi:hypothetical protein